MTRGVNVVPAEGGVERPGPAARAIRAATSFSFLRTVSFVHSAIYLTLLVCWLAPGLAGPTFVLGWAHGLLWIAMSLLVIAAARRGTIPFWLAVVVAVVGGIGPFAGTAGFVFEERRRARSVPVQAPDNAGAGLIRPRE